MRAFNSVDGACVCSARSLLGCFARRVSPFEKDFTLTLTLTSVPSEMGRLAPLYGGLRTAKGPQRGEASGLSRSTPRVQLQGRVVRGMWVGGRREEGGWATRLAAVIVYSALRPLVCALSFAQPAVTPLVRPIHHPVHRKRAYYHPC